MNELKKSNANPKSLFIPLLSLTLSWKLVTSAFVKIVLFGSSLVEGESKKLGFRKFELMATVSGILLYERKGYEVTEKIEYISKKGNKVPMYKMKKDLDDWRGSIKYF